MKKHLLMTILGAAAVCAAFLALPVNSAAAAGAPARMASASTACRGSYIIWHGDILTAIGARYYISFQPIASASAIRNPNQIYTGQRPCTSGGSASGGTPHPPPPPAPPPPTPSPPPSGATSSPPAGICALCPPAGYHAFGPVPDFRGDPYSSSRGQCTWWAATRRLDENFWGLGTYAYQWAFNARARGFRTGTTPAVGASVVFQPGVDGASRYGHVAHVVAVYSGGWFLVSEMNFYWNGGGWDRVSYRYVHVGPGVSFLY